MAPRGGCYSPSWPENVPQRPPPFGRLSWWPRLDGDRYVISSAGVTPNEVSSKIHKDTGANPTLESVRKHQAGLQSFRSMRRIEASRRNASALRLRFSQSFASLRQRLSQAKVLRHRDLRSVKPGGGLPAHPVLPAGRLAFSSELRIRRASARSRLGTERTAAWPMPGGRADGPASRVPAF